MSEEGRWEYYICWVWCDESERLWKIKAWDKTDELQAGLRYLSSCGWELVCIRQLGQSYREKGINVGEDTWPYLYLFKRFVRQGADMGVEKIETP